MNILLTVLAFAAIATYEMPPLIKKKEWKEFTVFMFLFAVAFTVAILLAFGIDVPSPLDGVIYLVRDVLHITYK